MELVAGALVLAVQIASVLASTPEDRAPLIAATQTALASPTLMERCSAPPSPLLARSLHDRHPPHVRVPCCSCAWHVFFSLVAEMNETDEMVKIEIVLQRDGVMDFKLRSTGVNGKAVPTLVFGLLQRAILEFQAHNKAQKP